MYFRIIFHFSRSIDLENPLENLCIVMYLEGKANFSTLFLTSFVAYSCGCLHNLGKLAFKQKDSNKLP